MMMDDCRYPNAPTWRLCHPVNIYVYRNGIENEKPQLVHIPMDKKKNMCTVLEAIQNRMKLPVGYPVALYHMDGSRVCKTYELESYNHYVVVTNLDRRFKCVDYGCVRHPLVVAGRDSKHVNALKYQNKRFDLFCRRKMSRKPLHELMSSKEPDGYGPSDLPPIGKPCGVLCHKIAPTTNRPTQCCSDEIMCVEGNAMDQEDDRCRKQKPCFVPPSSTFQDKELDELCNKVRCAVATDNPADNNLMDLIKKYKDVGSDIFKMFQDKINKDITEELPGKWQLDAGGSALSMETQQKLKDELLKAANATCQFSFDERGNYIPSEGCRIPGATNELAEMGQGPSQSRGQRRSGNEEQLDLSMIPDPIPPPPDWVEAEQRQQGEQFEARGARHSTASGGSYRLNQQQMFEVGMLEISMDHENNKNTSEPKTERKKSSMKKMMGTDMGSWDDMKEIVAHRGSHSNMGSLGSLGGGGEGVEDAEDDEEEEDPRQSQWRL